MVRSPGAKRDTVSFGNTWPKRSFGSEVFATLGETHRQELQYFRNHSGRMDYPTYLANGWRIGSGPVEAGCKRVVGGRLKGSGMRWRPFGTTSVCHLRGLYHSEPGQWESFWAAHAA